ncbi:hypothetical protein CTAYLR_009718 [Chrysophaeum taylorii]|uniref:NadR/Ttd14 AAA domain-containing protein n=1 Tax=Chrysophaeum taylorii TaxID=2483200 RepID=A0AAD7UFD4_9STRA|nr:hypothetical protein CTAYLR_009718 [Chrysophaeum taylorii]
MRSVGARLAGACFASYAVGHASSSEEGKTRYKNALHNIDPYLAARGTSDKPGVVGKRHKPGQTHVVRIALTGGPCAGKSSSLEQLNKVATAEGFDVVTAPESATLMFNSGLLFDDANDTGLLTFQAALMALQLQMERSLTAVAASTGRPTIIVFDRGLMDAKGYMEEDMWNAVLDAHNISEHYVLRRYDGVIHLVTAANGASEFYKFGIVHDDSGKVVYRNETPEQAVDLDNKMQAAWAPHTRHVVIDNQGSFVDKLRRATDAVLDIAHESHPQEWTRAHKKNKQRCGDNRADSSWWVYLAGRFSSSSSSSSAG